MYYSYTGTTKGHMEASDILEVMSITLRRKRVILSVKHPNDELFPAYQFLDRGEVVTVYKAYEKSTGFFCHDCGTAVGKKRYLCWMCASLKGQEGGKGLCECGYPLETNELCPICNPEALF